MAGRALALLLLALAAHVAEGAAPVVVDTVDDLVKKIDDPLVSEPNQ